MHDVEGRHDLIMRGWTEPDAHARSSTSVYKTATMSSFRVDIALVCYLRLCSQQYIVARIEVERSSGMLRPDSRCSKDSHYRAVATSPVSPVSTGPLFPSPNRANAQQTPMARTQHGDMLQHNTRRMAANSAKDRVFQQFSVLPTERSAKTRVWLVRLANDRKAETMQCYMAQRADVHALM